MVVDGVCLDSGCDLVQILKQGAYFLGKKEAQKRLDAFLQDHAHQPLDDPTGRGKNLQSGLWAI